MVAPKTYVLDTSVLLSTPKAIFSFAEHSVVLPLVVLKELERKRNDPEIGHMARMALRHLEELRIREGGSLRDGIVVNDAGGTVRIEINHVDTSGLPDALRADRSHDTRILAVAANLQSGGASVVLVSKDLPMRVLAETVGVPAEDYRSDQFSGEEFYLGVEHIDVGADVIDSLYADGEATFDAVDAEVPPINTGVVLHGGGSHSALARVGVNDEGSKVLRLIRQDQDAYEVKGRSAEQRIALSHLLDPKVGIVSLGGNAGTGKSLIALAAALDAVMERGTQKHIVVFRPLFAVGGQELGFLPGSEEEKMGPWGAAVFDALKAIDPKGESIKHLMDRKMLEVLPLTHIRGRTFTDTIVIIDEAQNLERNVLLTALSRLGEGSRVFMTHDVAQRDNLRVGRHDGVAAVIEKLKGQPLFAHVTLTKSERSPIAALVTDLLDDFE